MASAPPAGIPYAPPMFSLTVEHTFSAAHALVISGAQEPLHGHDFHVTVTVEGLGENPLDADGLLCDFHTVHDVLKAVCEPFHNNNLNRVEPFKSGLNPSAELIAKHLYDQLAARLGASLAPNARVASVRISESPGCHAIYAPRA